VKKAEVITKRIRSPTALRKVFRPNLYFSVRQNLIYSSYRTRGREYQQTPHIDRKKRQRSKDYEPQKRITLVLQKPVPCFSKILKGSFHPHVSCHQCRGCDPRFRDHLRLNIFASRVSSPLLTVAQYVTDHGGGKRRAVTFVTPDTALPSVASPYCSFGFFKTKTLFPALFT
jgi:hypothetical protein